MKLPEIPSQIWLTALLGSLSALSIFWIARDEELPGQPVERDMPRVETMLTINHDLQQIFAQAPDWQALCQDPLKVLQAFEGSIDGRAIVRQDERWEKRPSFLGQLEKDALRRCQIRNTNGQFCFQTSSEQPLSMNLYEVHLEFRQGRQPLSCDELSPIPEKAELLAFYTAYWGEGPGKFQRLSSGVRLQKQAH